MKPAEVFDAYGTYYDLLYGDKDYSAEVDYLCGLLATHGVSGRELLEFGCGTGRHAKFLVERGYRVTGIERSPEMLARAEVIDGFICQKGDICSVQLGRTFDAVISLFHVVSYQVTNAAVAAVFTRAAEHLLPGGLFVFDVWYSPAVGAMRPGLRVKRMADRRVEITRIAEPVVFPNENRVNVEYSVFARDLTTGSYHFFNETHPMRHFSLPELDLIAAMSGFERLSATGFLSDTAPGEDTWGACIVMRKI